MDPSRETEENPLKRSRTASTVSLTTSPSLTIQCEGGQVDSSAGGQVGGASASNAIGQVGGASASKAIESSSSDCDGDSKNAPHLLSRDRVDFKIVIPTLGRWRPACEICTDRSLRSSTRPFILCRTLDLLDKHGISPDGVDMWVSCDEELHNYRKALAGSVWANVNIRVGVGGIKAQRNHICQCYQPGEYIVSIDDDLADVKWKSRPQTLKSLPDGFLVPLINDAFYRMEANGCFICGLNSSTNPLSMRVDGLSSRLGVINGYFYAFINRHDDELFPSVADCTEDAERALRYFKKDRKLLRYRMYSGDTKCFGNLQGLQSCFGEADKAEINARRKNAERQAAATLLIHFPDLCTEPRQKRTVHCLEVRFRSMGGAVVPSTTSEEFAKNLIREKLASKKERVAERPETPRKRWAIGLHRLATQDMKNGSPEQNAQAWHRRHAFKKNVVERNVDGNDDSIELPPEPPQESSPRSGRDEPKECDVEGESECQFDLLLDTDDEAEQEDVQFISFNRPLFSEQVFPKLNDRPEFNSRICVDPEDTDDLATREQEELARAMRNSLENRHPDEVALERALQLSESDHKRETENRRRAEEQYDQDIERLLRLSKEEEVNVYPVEVEQLD